MVNAQRDNPSFLENSQRHNQSFLEKGNVRIKLIMIKGPRESNLSGNKPNQFANLPAYRPVT
jgi:hypothetical protein